MTAIERQRELLARADSWTAWLIERGQPEGQAPTVWHRSERWGLTTGGIWTTDAYSADMFSTREEAETFINEHSHYPSRFGRAVEHGFVRPGAPSDRAALLDIVEAAEAFRQAWDAPIYVGSLDHFEAAAEAMRPLRAALDRLHALPGWEE